MSNPVLQLSFKKNRLMNKKIPKFHYFETYRPFTRNGRDWYVLSNLTWNPTVISKHPDEASARDHARHLNELWREGFYANLQASCYVPARPPDKLGNASPWHRLKSLLADTLLSIRSRFQLR